MTTINISDRWAIKSDREGWTLLETRENIYGEKHKKAGESYPVVTPYYYGRLDHACLAIINNSPGVGGDHDSAASIVQAIGEAVREITTAIAKGNGGKA